MNFEDIERIKICKLWVKLNGYKLPQYGDTIIYNYKIYNIGHLIATIKRGFHKNIKRDIEKIFNCRISKKTDDMYINACKLWIDKHGQILPKQGDKVIYDDEIYNIGHFIVSIEQGHKTHLKSIIEELFNCKLQEFIKYDEDIYIKACKKWIEEHGQTLPSYNDIIKFNDSNVSIGKFIYGLKRGYHKNVKLEIEKMFECKIEQQMNRRIISNNDWIEICNKWVEQFGQTLPAQNNIIVYEGEKYYIGYFISTLKKGYHAAIKSDVEKIFNCRINLYYS